MTSDQHLFLCSFLLHSTRLFHTLSEKIKSRLPLGNQMVSTFKKLDKMIVEKRLSGKEPGTTQQSR